MAAGPGARAAVEGSPHDLPSQKYVIKGERKTPACLFCHLPAIGGDRFPDPDIPPSVAYYARTGLTCYACHDGTTIVSQDVDASLGPFHPQAHPLGPLPQPLPAPKPEQPDLPLRDNRMECITCHAPHDHSRRPFLREDMTLLCTRCHLGKETAGYGLNNVTGNHPVHETIEDDGGGATPILARPEFTVPFPEPYPSEGGRHFRGVHWSRGGHLQGGDRGTVECFTCHPVHGGETAAPLPELLAVPPVREVADEFCEGCHRGQRGDGQKSPLAPNPGGTLTGRTYHPCDDDLSNGEGWNLDIRDKVAFPMSPALTPNLMCTTCHTPHGGMENTPALRRPVNAETFCEECHLPEKLLFHHPYERAADSKNLCPNPPDSGWRGQNKEGKMLCSSCHVAHNAGLNKKEADFIPILRAGLTGDELCIGCHRLDNITCLDEDEGTASHFLGDPTIFQTYDDQKPPERTDPWPETKGYSRYGGDNGKVVVCFSCHTFRNYLTSDLTKSLPHFLLARGGNDIEWQSDKGYYLCTGCHGETPATAGSGHTHPLMQADVDALGQNPTPPATYTLNGHLNCDSCHLPHAAPKEGGYYILELVRSKNDDPQAIHPAIDFSVLCHLCHVADKY